LVFLTFATTDPPASTTFRRAISSGLIGNAGSAGNVEMVA
jgi:hypothetical protein